MTCYNCENREAADGLYCLTCRAILELEESERLEQWDRRNERYGDELVPPLPLEEALQEIIPGEGENE